MDASPKLVWAMLVLAATGGGALIGNTPPLLQAEKGAELPGPSWATPPPSFERPAQDQYAMVTPQGRFEVEELSHRGLYSQARYEVYGEYGAYAESEFIEMDASYAAAPQDDLKAPSIAQTQVGPAAAQFVAPPPHVEATAAQAASKVAAGSPRIVDVAAELAAHR